VSAGGRHQLVIVSGEEVRAVDLPPAGAVTIGRGEEAAVRIDDPSVSRRHAVLHVGETLEVEDLGGANGTFVRRTAQAGLGNATADVTLRQLVGRRAGLAVGDCLLFGTVCVVVRRAPLRDVPDLAAAEDRPAAKPVTAGMVVRDPAMQALYAEAARVAKGTISVLVLGETGVGKEILARAIHAHSPRASLPFVPVNCAALADSLVESELFGSERGAFTGATARAGLFEIAAGGTLFLDEVGELPPATQAKLLRVLEERTVTRLGSTRRRPVDVRFVAATNRDPQADSRIGRLRPDLFFRLNGASLVIPPLRDRPSEIEGLAVSFLSMACRDLERSPVPAISPAALDLLSRHAWPGNLRELRNAMERAAVVCTESVIAPEHLPPSLRVAAQAQRTPGGHPATLQDDLRVIERDRILAVLEGCQGNQSEAARQLGMPRRTLVSRLSDLGLTRRRGGTGRPG
jgi:two-component system response regulator AtoC